MLYVDQRWVGLHGIGRFAAEVLSRLTISYRDLGAVGSSSAPADMLSLARMRIRSRDHIYSPGYNVGLTSATQILTLHDLIHLEMGGSGARRRRLYYEYAVKPAIKRAGSVLTVSETSAGHIRTWLQDSSVEVINVGNGCSDVFAHSRSSKQGDYLLYVGNLKAHKNFDVLLRAIRLRPDYRLVAVVSDRINAEMLIEANGLQGQVKVVSDLEDTQLAGLYQGAIGLVLPSVLEGFGLPAVESLACGRPVAFFRGCQSVAEIVGLHGVAVENHGSGEEWAEAMDQLYGLQGSFEAPGRLWRDQYTWANVSSRVESHLKTVMELR